MIMVGGVDGSTKPQLPVQKATEVSVDAHSDF